MTTNVPLSGTPARRGSLLCESGPIHIISFDLITTHNSISIHTSIFIETPSLEVLPTKTEEDPSPHEMRLSPAGHQLIIIIIINLFYFDTSIMIYSKKLC